MLVYLKPTVTGDEPVDVANYARTHATFPHESTAEQWFDEAQFESYRMLGLQTVNTLCGGKQFASPRGSVPRGASRTVMTMRNAVIASGIFLAGLAGGWMLRSGGFQSQDMREAAPLPASPRPEGQNGLSETQRASFYHLSEGGELYPLDWLLALDVEVPASDGSVEVRRFLDNVERFGLLPDARSAGQSVRTARRSVACSLEAEWHADDRAELFSVPRRSAAVPESCGPDRRRRRTWPT